MPSTVWMLGLNNDVQPGICAAEVLAATDLRKLIHTTHRLYLMIRFRYNYPNSPKMHSSGSQFITQATKRFSENYSSFFFFFFCCIYLKKITQLFDVSGGRPFVLLIGSHTRAENVSWLSLNG